MAHNQYSSLKKVIYRLFFKESEEANATVMPLFTNSFSASRFSFTIHFIITINKIIII